MLILKIGPHPFSKAIIQQQQKFSGGNKEQVREQNREKEMSTRVGILIGF